MDGFFIRASLYALSSATLVFPMNLLSYPDQISRSVSAPRRCKQAAFFFPRCSTAVTIDHRKDIRS
jgi:hypothetical protein